MNGAEFIHICALDTTSQYSPVNAILTNLTTQVSHQKSLPVTKELRTSEQGRSEDQIKTINNSIPVLHEPIRRTKSVAFIRTYELSIG